MSTQKHDEGRLAQVLVTKGAIDQLKEMFA